tara:strand:- start:419 stop:745 length:327 start_codon:yes stop_codon:yes gene_type:complete
MKKFFFISFPFLLIIGCSSDSNKIVTLEGEMYKEVKEQFDCKTGKVRYDSKDLYKIEGIQLRMSEAVVPGMSSKFVNPNSYYSYLSGVSGYNFKENKLNQVKELCENK